MRYDSMDMGKGLGRERHGSKTFYNLLEEMAELHDKKSHDYAKDNNPFGNYEFAGILANMFNYSAVDSGFAGRLGEKLYRLYVLESGGKVPLNEPIADTERDLAVIMALWMAARRDRQVPKEVYIDEKAADKEYTSPAAPQISPAYHQASAIINILNKTEKRELLIQLATTV